MFIPKKPKKAKRVKNEKHADTFEYVYPVDPEQANFRNVMSTIVGDRIICTICGDHENLKKINFVGGGSKYLCEFCYNYQLNMD